MKNLPTGMIPDRDNIVYFDTEKYQFYMIRWEDGGNNDIAHRIYIPQAHIQILSRTKLLKYLKSRKIV
jgi:hypothetical protein